VATRNARATNSRRGTKRRGQESNLQGVNPTRLATGLTCQCRPFRGGLQVSASASRQKADTRDALTGRG